jgi:amino acid transporter
MSDQYHDRDKAEDLKVLHSMGYAQELERSMSAFSNFAISFSIICILSGGINSLAQATSGAGGGAIGIGWIIGCAVSGVFGVAMAQIGSAYPTAGGLYHWGSILGNRFTGWLTAWLNLLGLVTVLGAINVGTWNFFAGAFGYDATNLNSQMIFLVVITGLQALVNHFGIRLTAKLTDLSGYLIFAAALALTIGCLVAADHWDISRLWTFTNYSGQPADAAVWPESDSLFRVFLLGLLLPIYTITGYDASAHTSEETKRAAHSVPRGIVSSIVWSSLAGWVMLCAFVLMIPDMAEAGLERVLLGH